MTLLAEQRTSGSTAPARDVARTAGTREPRPARAPRSWDRLAFVLLIGAAAFALLGVYGLVAL